MIKLIENLIYPRRCVFCSAFLDKNSNEDVCPECMEHLPVTGKRCRSSGEFFSGCLSPLYYEGEAKSAVRRFKFAGKSSYSRQFGKMVADCIGENGSGGYDIVTWVPISFRRWRKRGYCQARLIAAEAAGWLGLSCRPLLKKRRHTSPQSKLYGLAARRANVSGAFAAIHCGEISGRSILLIDDVITTGATLGECARILLMAGAREVSCATLCRARRK